MQSSILQRIIGACVLAGIIALLWSLVFEDYEPQKLDQQSQIPDTPAFEKFEVEGGSILVKKQKELAEKQEQEKQQALSEKAQAVKPIIAKADTAKSDSQKSNQSGPQEKSKSQSKPKPKQTTKPKESPKPQKTAQAKPDKKPKPAAKAPSDDKQYENRQYDDNGVPITWVVQVASFSSEDNAKKLLKRLVDKQYKAYMRTNTSGDKTIYRLKIGPFIDLAKAKKVKGEIKRDFKLDGLVARYKVH